MPLTPLPKAELISRADEEAAAEIPELKQFITAGIPLPGSDQMLDGYTDIHQMLIKNPTSTYFMRVQGNLLNVLGISDKDIIIVDKALSVPESKSKVVVAVIKGQFCLKRVTILDGTIFILHPIDKFEPFEIKPKHKFSIWGIVIFSIHKT